MYHVTSASLPTCCRRLVFYAFIIHVIVTSSSRSTSTVDKDENSQIADDSAGKKRRVSSKQDTWINQQRQRSRSNAATAPPEHLRPLRKSATAGSSRILECEVRYPGGVYVQHIVTWRKVGVEAPIYILFDGYPPRMDSAFYGRIRTVGQASIELSDIRLTDAGWYECSVLFLDSSDDVNVNASWIYLTVNAPPVLTRMSPDFVARNEGDDVDIFCEATATPPATLTWLKDGRELTSAGHVTVAGSHVRLTDVDRSDAGVYSCTFKNVAGTVSHLIKLVIHGNGWVASGNIYFVTTPRNATVTEGNRVRLQCQAEGYPDNITYRWYRDGVDVLLIPDLMQTRGEVTTDGTLVISDVTKDDSGWYKCRATNLVGFSPHAQAYLNVTYLPRVVHMPDRVYLPRGLTGHVDCRVESNPPRTVIVWSKSGRMLDFQSLQHMHVSKHGTLIFQPVVSSDEGLYTCTPYSPLGAGQTSSPVRVFVREPPYFTLRPRPFYQRQPTQSVVMPCIADGDPPPVVTWRKADGTFPASSKIFPSGGNLTVVNLSVDDGGVYECVAASVVSSVVTASLLIIELTSQHPPYNVTAVTSRATVRLSWLPAYDSGFPLHYVIWVVCVDCRYRTPYTVTSEWNTLRVFNADVHVMSVTLYQMHPNTFYELMVLARNRLGDALFSDPVTVRTKTLTGSSSVVSDPHYSTVPEVPSVDSSVVGYDEYDVSDDDDEDEFMSAAVLEQQHRPPTPFNVTVKPYRNSLHITWSVPPSSSRPPDYFIVQYRTVGQWVPLTDHVDGAVTSFNWTTASRGATYHFRVIALYFRPSAPSVGVSGPTSRSAVGDDDRLTGAVQSEPSAVVTINTNDPMIEAQSGSSNALGSLGIITIGGAIGLVAIFFVVQCYRGWQRWNKARQSGTAHVLPTTEFEQDTQYDNQVDSQSQVDNGKATQVRETPI